MNSMTPRFAAAALLGVVCAMGFPGVPGGVAMGQSRVGPQPLTGGTTPPPAELDKVGIDQNLGAQLPLDVPLVDEAGKVVTLGDYFAGEKPVLIEFAYFDCPLLCPMIESGIVEALRGAGWVPGEQFEILTISFDPQDTPAVAAAQKEQMLHKLARPDTAGNVAPPAIQAGAVTGWHYLTGTASHVQRVADAAGFRFAAVPQTQDFAHGAVIIFASPSGEITRYLPGHVFPVRDFRIALTEASEGRQGSIFDMVLQLCYHYDPTLGTYTADAMMLMKLGGAFTVTILSFVIGGMLYFERKRKHRLAEEDAAGPEKADEQGVPTA